MRNFDNVQRMIRFSFFFLVTLFTIFNPLEAEEEVPYQTEFPIVTRYLSSYNRDLKTLSGETFLCLLQRTGSNITMAILSQLTGKNCFCGVEGHSAKVIERHWSKGIVFNRAKVKTDSSKFPILTSCDTISFDGLRNNTLIITLRNYKEYFSRSGNLVVTKKSIKKYMNLLDFYDKWDDGRKHIVRYDDLIENPTTTIEELADFINAPVERVDELLANYEDFRIRVLKSYNVFPKGTKNPGTASVFHQIRVPEQKLVELGERLKAENPYLFNKYLTIY